VIKEKEIADANRLILDFPDAGVQVLNGRYGPYITDKQRNAKIPKERDPKSLTIEECQALLAAAPVRTFGRWGKRNGKSGAAKAKAPAAKAVKDGAQPKAPAGAGNVAPLAAAAKRLRKAGATSELKKPATPSAAKAAGKPSSTRITKAPLTTPAGAAAKPAAKKKSAPKNS
jgi:DNA topoisomerase I